MKIYFVRHGKDEDGFRGGWSKRGLVKQGIDQSKKLGEYLYSNANKYEITTIISSDLNRAIETTREIEQYLKLSVIYQKEWREMNNGLLAGIPNRDAEAKYPGIYFNTLQMNSTFPEGESPIEFFNRIKTAFEELCLKIEKGSLEPNVLLVTHGGVINVVYYLLLGIEWSNKSKFFSIDNTSIHSIERTNDGWKISEMNMKDHL